MHDIHIAREGALTVTSSNFERKRHDLYETEKWATEALLRHFPVDGLVVWEPAAGNHLMADVLREAGASVVTSDIATYDRPHDWERNFFLPCEKTNANAIITNPPYGKGNRDAVRFAELALERCDGLVALLLTAKFDFGKTRRHLFQDNPRFCAKIALLDRISWAANGETGTEDHAWYVWHSHDRVERQYGKPIMLWEGKISS